MSDLYRGDLLRKRYKKLASQAKKAEDQGRVEQAADLYEEAITVLKAIKVQKKGGRSEDKKIKRIQKRIENLRSNVATGSESSENGDEEGSWDMFNVRKPEIRFSDVGGREKLKKQIREKFLEPVKESEEHRYYGLDTPNGLLLYGPPGTGKTFMAKAIGGELDATFVWVRGGDLKSKYKGESEGNVTKLFDKAKKSQPCVLFFDEADALFTRRQEFNSDSDMVNAILSEVQELQGEDVFVVGATNAPKRLDKAATRPGRFDEKVKVGYPSMKTRAAILDKILSDRPVQEGRVDLRSIADDTHGYSAADLAKLVDEAAREAKSESIDINQKHLRYAVSNTTGSKK